MKSTTVLTHENCETCIYALEGALTMAAITGSTGAVEIRQDVDGTEHRVDYHRTRTVQQDGVPMWVDADRVIR